jgi:diguanylate cyclase (GGDEF)-like protein
VAAAPARPRLPRRGDLAATLGAYAIAALLRQVAARLDGVVRDGETLARFGGDEFVVITTCAEGGGSLLPQARRLREALAAPFVLDDRSFALDASLAAAAADADADAAMYRAEELGRGRAELHRVGRPRAIAPRP